jgi:hypothetical protein
MRTKTKVTEVPICHCTGEQLERMASECFRSGSLVPDHFRCPCGWIHAVGPGIEREEREEEEGGDHASR